MKIFSKNLILFSIIVFLFLGPNECFGQEQNLDLRNIDIAKFREKFVGKFCKGGLEDEKCKRRWENFSLLLKEIKNDVRIKNIGIAAFLMATAYTETEIRDFSPAAKEIKGKSNESRDYWIPDSKTNQVYFGRGWVQLTRKEIYEKAKTKLGIDFVNNPDLSLETKNSYNILYSSLTEGWLETYRSNGKGAAGKIPIKLGDFIEDNGLLNNGLLNYTLARATINANCVNKCAEDEYSRFEFKKDCYIPTSEHLDASEKTTRISIFFENAIRYSLFIRKGNPKLMQLIRKNFHAGCFLDVGTEFSSDEVFFNLDGYDQFFQPLKAASLPKGYTEGYTDGKYKILVEEVESKEVPDSCLTEKKYNVVVIQGNKRYSYKLDGFCGC
jgi:Chitinase class I